MLGNRCYRSDDISNVVRFLGFSSLLQQKNPHLFTMRCVIPSQHLVSKSLSPRLQASLSVAVNAINKITANAKNDRLFREQCIENEGSVWHAILLAPGLVVVRSGIIAKWSMPSMNT